MSTDAGADTASETREQPPVPARTSWLRAYQPVAITAVLLALLPAFIGGSRYFMSIAILMLVFAAYAVAFNLIFGSTAQLFLCLGALSGISAYSVAILGNDYDWSLLLSLPLGVAVAAALGALFSWVAVRRHLDIIFIGIVTLAFSLVFYNVLLGMRNLTGGETGMLVDAGSGTFLRNRLMSYYLFVAVVVAFMALYRLIERSHMGWAFRALKDDELAAELAGINVARYRILAGMIGGAMVGLSGGLFAAHEGFISPTTFAFPHVDVKVLVILAFGGIGSLMGPIVGAGIVAVVDEMLRPLGQLRLTVYGVVIITLFLFFRHGVVRGVTDLVSLALGKRRKPKHEVL